MTLMCACGAWCLPCRCHSVLVLYRDLPQGADQALLQAQQQQGATFSRGYTGSSVDVNDNAAGLMMMMMMLSAVY